MTIKLFEVRDAGTFIPAIAIKFDCTSEDERFLLARAGHGMLPEEQAGYVYFGRLDDMYLLYDHYSWYHANNTTMFEAHKHVKKNFDSLVSGDVIDVEFIQGKSKSSKVSEIEKE